MAEINQSRVFVKITGDGVTPGTVGWPELREFVDQLIKAATALDPSLRADQIAPVQIKKGSLGMAFKVPTPHVEPFERLKDSDHSSWTPAELRATRPFFDLARRRHYGVSIKTPGRRLSRMKAPPAPDLTTTYVAETSLLGQVERAGGVDPKVTIVFDRLGRRVCTVAHREITMDLGKVLYRRVKVRGLLTRVIETGEFSSFLVQSFDLLDQKLKPEDFSRAMAKAVGDSMRQLDVEAFLKAIR